MQYWRTEYDGMIVAYYITIANTYVLSMYTSIVMSSIGRHVQHGWTVVHYAAYNGHLEMLQELLERFNCEADKKDRVNMVLL